MFKDRRRTPSSSEPKRASRRISWQIACQVGGGRDSSRGTSGAEAASAYGLTAKGIDLAAGDGRDNRLERQARPAHGGRKGLRAAPAHGSRRSSCGATRRPAGSAEGGTNMTVLEDIRSASTRLRRRSGRCWRRSRRSTATIPAWRGPRGRVGDERRTGIGPAMRPDAGRLVQGEDLRVETSRSAGVRALRMHASGAAGSGTATGSSPMVAARSLQQRMEYQLKFGPLGKLLDAVVVKRKWIAGIQGLLRRPQTLRRGGRGLVVR